MIRKIMLCGVCLVLAGVVIGCQHAAVKLADVQFKLPKIFSDNMVLQRDMEVPIWGMDAPGRRVSVRIGGNEKQTRADEEGRWMLRLAPMAAGGPHTLMVSGSSTKTFSNVLIGDVWICSGQSNMEMNLRPGPLAVYNVEQEIASANLPSIRLFDVPRSSKFAPQEDLGGGQWQVCSPETVETFSAVGFFFGREIHQHLGVPIGLINSSKGASPAEAWTSAEALSTHPDYAQTVRDMPNRIASAALEEAEWEKRAIAWEAALDTHDAGYANGEAAWASPTFSDSAWGMMTLPGYWEDEGFPNLDGFMWFRHTVDVPEAWAEKPLKLGLAAINDMDRAWFNGTMVGKFEHTAGWTAPRVYDVPGNLVHAGKNVIAVRVYDVGNRGGMYGAAEDMWLKPAAGGDAIPLAGTWRCKTGLDLKTIEPKPQAPQFSEDNFRLPAVLYNGMIAPIVPYAMRGAIWYQGEGNAGKAYQYRTLFPLMIRDWRQRWGQGDFPFLYVQLASFLETKPEPTDDPWAELREAQLMTLAEPNTGMAVTIDIGDAENVHPRNKQDVGKRLALAARHVAYGENLVYSGPTYKSMRIEGNCIRISFDHVGGGLVAKGGEKLSGFAVAGADQNFVWADASLDGNTVIVKSDRVSNPVAVRYAWASNPLCNLLNKEGLPASPFRTDNWTGMTEGMK
jgi:sialate O-acetylesterase